jgi:hypothetical protein
MPPLDFGQERQSSPVLAWLMMTPRETPRWDSAQVLFDLLRDRNLIQFKNGKWAPTPPAELMAGTARNDGLGAGLVVTALSLCGGRAKWPQLKDEAARILGKPIKHWPFVRCVQAAQELGVVVKLPGVGVNAGYKLANKGTEVADEVGSAVEAELEARLDLIVLTQAEMDKIIAMLPVAPAPALTDDEWYGRCLAIEGGLLAPGRLVHPDQMMRTAARNQAVTERASFKTRRLPDKFIDL